MTVAIALSIPLSRFSFGSAEYAVPIVLVSVVLLLTSLQEGQLALLQGLRMIGKMAKAKVAGAVAGFVLTVPMYWWLGVKGIVPAMILTAAAMLGHFMVVCPRHPVEPAKLTPKETFRGGLSIAKLGFFIVVTTLRRRLLCISSVHSSRKRWERMASECFRLHGTFQMYT